jgi:dihydroflavonol-4-reductase
MRVMVTGGTGFVGSHTVAEIIKNGHQVKLLVRSPDRVAPALEPLGIKKVEVIKGDVLDRASIEKAAEGCDATVHCGSVYSLDPRAADTIKQTNVTGTQAVIEVASKLGHDPIIHVSSYVALAGNRGCTLNAETKPVKVKGVYPASKADSDIVARRFQEQGVPVVITYPGTVWGPNDPHYGESCQIMENLLKGFWRIGIDGKLPISDVREIARLHALLLEKGKGPRRYICFSQNVTMKEILSIVSAITGRNLRNTSLPAGMVLGMMRGMDMAQHILPYKLPYNYQSVYVVSLKTMCDDSKTRNDFQIEPRTIADTLGDTIQWMYRQGHLTSKLVGKLGHETDAGVKNPV